jgi:hypothetical protein
MKRWQGSCLGAFLALLVGGGALIILIPFGGAMIAANSALFKQKTFANEEVGLKGLAASFTAAGICGGLAVLFLMVLAAIVGARLTKPKATT